MKLLFDLHTHTLASGHAYSSLKENIEAARDKGLLAMGTSDHAKSIPGACGPLFFKNYKIIRDEIMGVRIYKGIEANIMDRKGTLDVPEGLLKTLDYVIASLHLPCMKPGTEEENTDALIGAMKNPYVKIIGHPDDARYPLNYRAVVQAAAREKVALEINNSSLAPTASRKGAHETLPEILKLCMEYRVPVIAGSDAHIYYDVGNLEYAEEMLVRCGFPEELVINTDLKKLDLVLNKNGCFSL